MEPLLPKRHDAAPQLKFANYDILLAHSTVRVA